MLKRLNKWIGNLPAGRWALVIFMGALTLVFISANDLRADEIEPADQQKDVTIGSVTITARKVEESAKDVPFSLTVIGGTELEDRRVKSIEDVLRQTPGVDVSTLGSINTDVIRIRGVGSLYSIGIDDTSVLINLDGMPQSLGMASMSAMDIERVEVLKGPQGTLMGRNSEAGAVNVVTRKPTRHLEGYVRGEYGTKNTFDIETAISGPATDTLSARLAAKYSGHDNQIEYYGTNEAISRPWDVSVRGTLLWEPTENTDMTLTLGYEEKNNRTEALMLAPYKNKQKMDMPKGALDGRKDSQRATLELVHDFNIMTFTSTTGYTHWDSFEDRLLYDRSLANVLLGMDIIEGDDVFRKYDVDTYYQEFRLSSKPESHIFWVTGVNFYHSDKNVVNGYEYKNIMAYQAMNGVIDSDFDTTDYAIFGEVTYPATTKLKLTGGLRYTWDKKKYKSEWTPSSTNPYAGYFGPSSDSGEINSSFITGRASVSYALAENVNTYLTYARGHKSKAFQDLATEYIFTGDNSGQIVDGADIDSYELGLKVEAPDKKSGLNLALFFNNIKNDHINYIDLVTMTNKVGNNDTETKGVELEGFLKFRNGFTITAGGGYTDAKITGVPATSQDVKKGNAVPETPEWNAMISVSHQLSLPSFWGMRSPSLFTSVTNRYVGKREADPANSFQLNAYNKLDFRMGIMSENIEFYVWGDNLLDEIYDLYGFKLGTSVQDGRDVLAGGSSRGRVLGLGLAYYY